MPDISLPAHGSPNWDSELNNAVNAISAQSDSAAADATQARGNATQALSVAQGVDSKASTALDNSTAAVSTANDAKTLAQAAQGATDAGIAGNINLAGSQTQLALNAAIAGKAPARFAFLADGNSITNYWTTTEGFAAKVADRIGALGGDLVVIEAGVGGDRTSDILGRLPALYAANSASVSLCLASVNDRKQNVGLTPAQTMENLRRMVAIARLNGATPLLQTDPPLNPVRATVADANFVWASEYDARAVNDMVRAYATSQGLPLADVAAAFAYNDVSASTADGIHPIGTTTSGIGGLDIVMVTLADAIGGKPVQVYGTPNILPTLAGTWDPDEASLTTTWDRVAEDTGQTDHVAVATCTGTAGSAYDASAITRDDGTGNHYLALCEVAADRSAAVKFYKVAAGPTPTELTEFAIPAGTLGDQTEITLASIGTAHTVRINGITTIEATDATYTTGTSIGVEKVGNPLNVTSLSAYTA